MPKCGRRTEVPPFESGFGGGMSEGFINRNAPFGTQYTPVIRTKIIGGKVKYVTETQRSFKLADELKEEKRVQDDGVQTERVQTTQDFTQTSASKQNWKNHSVLPAIASSPASHQQEQSAAASKNIKKPLPPIASNNGREDNSQTQTDGKRRNEEVSQDETNQIEQKSMNYSPRTYSEHAEAREHQWKPAAGYSYLPNQPITLTQDQEIFLLRKLAEDLSGVTLTQVKDVYQHMASNDHQLSGWGSYTDLGIALQKHGIYPNMNTLRLLASTCVSTTDMGYIDYEKLLSFLITAVKKSMEQQNDQQHFYSPRDYEGSSPVPDRTGSEGRLLRLVQQQLMQSASPLDIERLRTMFSKADRYHRLTLSQTQIKEVCARMNVAIEDSVINEMLAHCQSHGDGQYLWTDFIGILEKVQPQATGLIIPQSKRPLEYAKRYLQPSVNWPHPDPSLASPQQHTQPQRVYEPEQTSPRREEPGKTTSRMVAHQVSAPVSYVSKTNHSEKIQTSPRGLGVQTNTTPWSKSGADPWFDGFKKMAEALYRNDLNKKGSMKPEKCKWLVTEYNEIYDLQLDHDLVDKCVQLNTTTSGTVIDGLLQHLLAIKQT